MNMSRVCAAWLLAVGLLVSLPVFAHHSFAAEYDQTKPVTLKGTVNKLMWVNPHAYLYVDVKDETGKSVTWAMELLSPNALARQGWNKNSIKPGESVTVEGYLAKDGKPMFDGAMHGNSKLVTKGDGQKVFQGSSLTGAQ